MKIIVETNEGVFDFDYSYDVVMFTRLTERGDVRFNCASELAVRLSDIRRKIGMPLEDFLEFVDEELNKMNPNKIFTFELQHLKSIVERFEDYHL